MNRRHFLTTAGSALLSAGVDLRAEAGTVKTVSVIHTTDLHGHILPTVTYDGLQNVGGLARCATQIKAWRRENPLNILLDIGDLYQGTDVGMRTKGEVMVRLINQLQYDGWVLGNHDFDWGRDILDSAIGRAAMPVLAANVFCSGKKPGAHEKGSPLARLVPHMMKDVGGFKVGIVGVGTPGLSSWLAPQILREIVAIDPLAPARESIRELRAAGAQAIVLCGHMGFKAPNFCRDDFANRVDNLTRELPDVDVFIGAHTHKDVPHSDINKKPFTQANYYGINLGRVDLTFHVESGKLVDTKVFTVLMDDRYAEDPAVISAVAKDLDLSKTELAKPVGTLTGPLSGTAAPGKPSDQQLLIGAAIKTALAKKKDPVDIVLHGAFNERDVPAGLKTVADMWDLMPYENFVVTAELTTEEIVEVTNEAFTAERTSRNLMGCVVRTDGSRQDPKVTALLDRAGRPLPAGQRFKIAFNSYDAQSGGQRLLRLKEILSTSEAKTRFHELETRQAVIDFFVDRKSFGPKDLVTL